MKVTDNTIEHLILTDVEIVIEKHCNDHLCKRFKKNEFLSKIVASVYNDLKSLTFQDPATGGDMRYVYQTYSSFKAVLYYRIASNIHYYDDASKLSILRYIARSISEEAKERTKIEIHPAAVIGSNFVIDHGVGTVIGETCVIGDNCCIFQGVILGATGIAGNKEGKRHPTLGNFVEIGAFTKILGPVVIGDNVKIAPDSIITQDVPGNVS